MTHASVLAVSILTALSLATGRSQAQDPPKAEKQERKEIIIRQKGDGKEKMTIVVDGEKVTINGKPIAEYEGDDIVIRKIREVEMGAPRAYARPHARIYRAPRAMGPMTWDFRVEDGLGEGAPREPRAFLGVVTEKTDAGVKITEVSEGSAAEKAGLKSGDVITSLAGKKVESPQNLLELVRAQKPEQEVEIGYTREKKKKTAKVKLGSTRAGDARVFEFTVPEFDERSLDALGSLAPRFEIQRDHLENMEREMERGHRSMERAQRELERQHMDLERRYNAPEAFQFEFDREMNWTGRPRLGIRVSDIESGGVKITEVEPGSPADKAGLKKDDVLAYIDGKKIDNTDHAVSGLREGREKSSLPITVMREGKPLNVEVKMPRDLKQANL